MGKSKKCKATKVKHPQFKAKLNGKLQIVRAKGPEQAAKKIFRSAKAAWAEIGTVEVGSYILLKSTDQKCG